MNTDENNSNSLYTDEKIKLYKCKNTNLKDEVQLMECYFYLLEKSKTNKNDKRLTENIKQLEKYIFNI